MHRLRRRYFVEIKMTDRINEFVRITAAHQYLLQAQTYEEQRNPRLALESYRSCVDLLLEELIFAQGTNQSRLYLREKSHAIMDRIDHLKSQLEPIQNNS